MHAKAQATQKSQSAQQKIHEVDRDEWIDFMGRGLDDDLFHVGGSSISAMKVVGAARKKGIGLTVARVISLPRLLVGIFLASVVSTAWAVFLSQMTGEKDVVYGHVVNGRNATILCTENFVGPCLKYYPSTSSVPW